MYAKIWKRVLDILLSLSALIVLLPIILLLIFAGLIAMRGNPFFVQKRPGKIDKSTGKEHIFSLVKFRTMNNRRDADGNLLPDDVRLNSYGRFLRNTSLDELPELFNILIGDMSIVGPRPLLVEYLPWYTEVERHRHDIRPGLTGFAQVNGRNSVDWDKRFTMDIYYVNNYSFALDIKIIIDTVKKVFKRSDIADDTRTVEGNFAQIRSSRMESNIK